MNEKQDCLRNLFNEAAEITGDAERAAFLERACGDDASLRQRIEKLLKAHADAGGFLGAPDCTTLLPNAEKAGDRIGRYKFLQQIGEGGCGVVYMAEQEEPVRRRVALKVIKLGMDTKSVIARFEAERQALALMNHPNIAKVLDAGATDAGRPYFVMELVKGVRVTEYCDQNNLPTAARLDLFMQICRAIQHAHQKGIIHRDIKPSNILVTLHDGVPVPKVIDFGIAKATDQHLTDKSLFTAFEQLMGTPAYMSPEQAELSGLDIDTRSDIYALGVLLYELLTGKTPFDGKELLASGLEAMRRTIRDQEPARPSTRLSTMLAADLTTVARQRQCESAKLTSAIRGDLDWIVMKALEKDRTRRYDTANGLAMDIARHLNNEPIVARSPTQIYRFHKMVRRNKLAFAAASAVLIALILGLGVSTWMFLNEKETRQRAVAAEQNAKTEASKSRQVAQFLKEMLQGVGPSVALGRDTKMLREILDKTAERVGKDLKDQPVVEAELRTTIGNVYQGILEYEKAETMQREALALRRKLLDTGHMDVARLLNNLALCACRKGKLAEAETIFREALAIRTKLLVDEQPSVAEVLNNLGEVLMGQGKLAEGLAMVREALAMRRKLLGNDDPVVRHSLEDLTTFLRQQGKLAEAEFLLREALTAQRKQLGDEHPVVVNCVNSLARVLSDQGRLAEAESMAREALASVRNAETNKPAVLEGCLSELAEVLYRQARYAEAEPLCREVLAGRRARLKAEPDARRLAAEHLAGARFLSIDHWEVLLVAASLGRLLADWAWVERDRSADFSPLRSAGRSEEKRAEIRAPKEMAGEAERLLRDCLAIRLVADGGWPWHTADFRSQLGSALLSRAVTDADLSSEVRLAKLSEAEALLLEGNSGLQQDTEADSIHKRDAIERLVRLYGAWDKPEKFAEWKQKLTDFDKTKIEKKSAVSKP